MRAVSRLEPWPATVAARNLKALRQEICRAHRAGELAAAGPVYVVRGGYAVDVLRLKDRHAAPRWRRPALVAGGVALTLAAAAAAGWWLSMALAPVALPLIVCAASLVPAGWWVTRDRGCTIIHVRR